LDAVVWRFAFDGSRGWVAPKDANVNVFDLTLLRGYGAFEFFITYDHQPFLLDHHLLRFFRTASILDVQVPLSKEEIIQVIKEGLESKTPREWQEVSFRFILTSGFSDSFFHPETPTKGSSFFIILQRCPPIVNKDVGINLQSVPFARWAAAAKHTNYFAGVMQRIKAHRELNAGEILAYDPVDGAILECSACNFFAVLKNKRKVLDGVDVYTVVTAPIEGDRLLDGCTRRFVIDLIHRFGRQFENASEHPFVVEVEDQTFSLTNKDIPTFDEAFLSSTTKEVMAVFQIDGKPVGNEPQKVGFVTKLLQQWFNQEKHNKTTKL